LSWSFAGAFGGAKDLDPLDFEIAIQSRRPGPESGPSGRTPYYDAGMPAREPTPYRYKPPKPRGIKSLPRASTKNRRAPKRQTSTCRMRPLPAATSAPTNSNRTLAHAEQTTFPKSGFHTEAWPQDKDPAASIIHKPQRTPLANALLNKRRNNASPNQRSGLERHAWHKTAAEYKPDTLTLSVSFLPVVVVVAPRVAVVVAVVVRLRLRVRVLRIGVVRIGVVVLLALSRPCEKPEGKSRAAPQSSFHFSSPFREMCR
jgi:hypothetical protein